MITNIVCIIIGAVVALIAQRIIEAWLDYCSWEGRTWYGKRLK